MAWHQISSNFAHLKALQLIQLRSDSGISISDNETAPKRSNIFDDKDDVVFVPKEEPRDILPIHNSYCPRDTLPTFEEHDAGGYNFKLSIRPQCVNNSQWLYSEALNKLFIRLNKILNVDITYTPKVPGEQLRVRSFICFLKEVSEPVRRCANHFSKDYEIRHHIERENVLRCENPSAIYCGTAEGKNIRDRYSVVVPLYTETRSQNETVRQTLAFKFTCQNSCIGRKQTCLMILLEDTNGSVLAQRWLYLRICSCPKRDKSFEERHALLRCVAGESDTEENSNANISSAEKELRRFHDSTACANNAVKQYDLQSMASGGVRLVMEVSSKDIALATIQFAYSRECVNIVNQSKDAQRSVRHVRKLKRLYDEGRKL